MRGLIRESLDGLYRREPERLLARVRLQFTVPELRARVLDSHTHGVEQLAPLLRRKRRAAVDDLQVRVIFSALLAAVVVALDLWQHDSGKADLLALFDEATDALARGTQELRRARRPPPPSRR